MEIGVILAFGLLAIIYSDEVIKKLHGLQTDTGKKYRVFTMISYVFLVFLFYQFNFSIVHFITFIIMFYIGVIDLEHEIIPNGSIVFIGAMGIIHAYLFDIMPIRQSFMGFGLFFILLLFVVLVEKFHGSMLIGGGDLKLFMAIGLLLGVFYGYFLVLIMNIIGLAARVSDRLLGESKSKEGTRPIGPFIHIAYLVTMLIFYYMELKVFQNLT